MKSAVETTAPNVTDSVNPAGLDHNRPAQGTRNVLEERKLTIPEAAKAMGIGTTSLRRLIVEGKVPVLNILRKVLLLESDVESFVRESRVVMKAVKKERSRLPPLPDAVARSPHLVTRT